MGRNPAGHLPQTLIRPAIANRVFCQAKCRGRPTQSISTISRPGASNEFQTHGFVDNAAIARTQRQRLADVLRGGSHIERQSSLAGIGLLGEVQPEFAIPERFCRVFEKLALPQRGDAALTAVDIAFRKTGAVQQGGRRDVARAKDGDGLPSGEPGRDWKTLGSVSALTFDAPSARYRAPLARSGRSRRALRPGGARSVKTDSKTRPAGGLKRQTTPAAQGLAPAGDVDQGAGDIRGRVADEPYRRLRDFLGRAGAAHGRSRRGFFARSASPLMA